MIPNFVFTPLVLTSYNIIIPFSQNFRAQTLYLQQVSRPVFIIKQSLRAHCQPTLIALKDT